MPSGRSVSKSPPTSRASIAPCSVRSTKSSTSCEATRDIALRMRVEASEAVSRSIPAASSFIPMARSAGLRTRYTSEWRSDHLRANEVRDETGTPRAGQLVELLLGDRARPVVRPRRLYLLLDAEPLGHVELTTVDAAQKVTDGVDPQPPGPAAAQMRLRAA